MTVEEKAMRCMNEHKKAFEAWTEGNIVKCWEEENGAICVRYESGKFWHYKHNVVSGALEWW